MKPRSGYLYYIVCCLLTSIPFASWGQSIKGGKKVEKGQTAPLEKKDDSKWPDIIIVPEDKPWHIPLFTILATQSKQTHLFVSGASTPERSRATLNVLESLKPETVLTTDPSLLAMKLESNIKLISQPSPQAMSEYLATTYWNNPSNVVLIKFGDPSLAILGAVYAHYLRSPMIYFDDVAALNRLSQAYSQSNRHVFSLKRETIGNHKVKSRQGLLKALIGRMQKQEGGVQNLIATRLPETDDIATSNWLAGYAGIRRNAPVVFVRNYRAVWVESRVKSFIQRYSLNPRSITILAGENEIGRVSAVIKTADNQTWNGLLVESDFFEVEADPFCMPYNNELLSRAVGRIPFGDAVTASLFFCHLYAREWLKTRENRHVAMVANPLQEKGLFPLAETISRLTSKEVRNFRYTVDEFYGVKTDHQSINTAIRKSDLVIFEGHIEDQHFLDDPSFFQTDDGENSIQVPHKDSAIPPSELFDGLIGGEPHNTLFSLPKHPILILQSCNSLQPETMAHLVQLGGAGLVGSRTKIHSASGSAFIHCVLSRSLYEGKTIGEAMVDARNYFLCLQDLKDMRGHSEQAKSFRVALSFGLWGDPETRLFVGKKRQPSRAPVTIKGDGKAIILRIPDRYLPKSVTDKYNASLFPASQTAGLVRFSKKKPDNPGKVLPLYFFTVANLRGNDFPKSGFLSVKGDRTRAVYRMGSQLKTLYIVYFPKKEIAGDTVSLEF